MKTDRRTAGSGRKETDAEIEARQMKCDHVDEPAKDIITFKGRTVIVNALHCTKCGVVSISPAEAERARKELNPSILHRFKEMTGNVEESAEALIFRGRVL